jgi:carbonic anhydrase
VSARKPHGQKPAEPAAHAAPHGEIHWSYEGDTGPEHWGKLKPEWAACEGGRRQSPIDIRDGIGVDLPPVTFDYRFTRFNVVDNGHTVQVNVGEGSSITVSGRRYELKQFHFHKPSEERVGGKLYDMVAHLVHQDYDGRLAVVAVLLEKGAAVAEHPVIQTVWNNLPLERNVEMTAEDAIDLNGLLPATHDYFTYMGSLTTPPCSEGVLWMVMKTPLFLSEQQVAIFGHLYRNNARPVQAANGRLIKQSR